MRATLLQVILLWTSSAIVGLRAAPLSTTVAKPDSTVNATKTVVEILADKTQRDRYLGSVVRVSATAQPYDFARPWSKRAPVTRRALGTILEGNRVLVTAEVVANSTYIELESPDGEQKQPARVECVDYEADLALLKPDSDDFFKTRSSVGFGAPSVGDTLTVFQLEANGNPLFSKGQMTTAEVVRYPIDDSSFLVGRLNVPLQMRESTQSLPLFEDGKLAGLMLRYDAQSGLLDFIPAVVIEHFLKDALRVPYEGFPRMGCSFAVTRDPQLRRYLGLNGNNGGVLITQILKGGPAEKGGLMKGDVLLEIAGKPIDSDGNYRDEAYGRISLGHLVCTKHFEGDKVKVRLLRDMKELELEIPVARRHPEQYQSQPYIIDRAPAYYVLGGLVFQELSRQYLKEFGADWARKAPLELVNLDRTQGETDQEVAERVVLLSRVLPSDVTIGYEDLRHLVLKSINGETIHSLSEIPEALKKAKLGVHRIEFTGDPSVMFVDAKAAESVAPMLQRSYGLPALSRLP
jgi:S1-C subfamily serine protease